MLQFLNYGLHFFFFGRLAYGFRAHIMNLGSYCLGLLPMTFLVVNIKPGMAFNSTGIINETSDRLEILDTKVFFHLCLYSNLLKEKIIKKCVFSLRILVPLEV